MPAGSHRFTSRGGDRATLPVRIRLGGSVLERAPPADGRREHLRVLAPALFVPHPSALDWPRWTVRARLTALDLPRWTGWAPGEPERVE